ncbi:MAG TPA: hypothetical protein VNW25_00010 [Candidatus Sulfotelmatobacter sp.]|nr:hypothetical protein [Candidatus Sulfotelmatobacter sp.]
MATTGATGGWRNRSAYPLMVSQIVDHALVKLQADQNLSRGKALNKCIEEGLISFGYLQRPKTVQELQQEAGNREAQWVRDNWEQMSSKARAYWGERYPDARDKAQVSPAGLAP